ncbi:MAG: hypothetical protein ACYC5M_15400 [Anaerolineae bacterium]
MRRAAKLFWVLAVILCLVVPMAVSAQGTWSSGVNIQNLSDTVDAEVRLVIYDSSTGAEVFWYPSTGTVTIPAGGNISVYIPGLSGLADGRYSAMIESTEPVAAVVNTQSPGMLMGDSYLGADEAALSADVRAPLVFRNRNGFSSTLYIQNAHSSQQSITVELYPAGSSTPAASRSYDVPASASVEVDLRDAAFAAFEGRYGGAKITGAAGNVAAVAMYVRSTAGGAIEGTNGQFRAMAATKAGREWYAPLVYKNHSGWATGITIQNTEAVTTVVSVEYVASAQSSYAGTVVTDTLVLGPNATDSFYLPSNASLPASRFYGAATVTSSAADVLVIVNSTNYLRGDGAVASSYEALSPADAGAQIAMPLVFRMHADTDSGINVQNVGSAATDVTLVVTKSPSSNPLGGLGPWTFTVTDVGPGEGATFYLPGLMAGVTKMYGSASISTTGEPVVVVVTSASYARGISSNYIGIKK